MAVLYGDISPRTAALAAKELLKRGLPFLVLEKFGQSKELPSNSSKTMIFRRYSALDSTPNVLQEGVTPMSKNLIPTDIPVTLVQMGDLTTISDVVLDTHEDNVLKEAIELLGEQAAQMVEKMRFGILKAGTNVFYSGVGAVSRPTVSGVLTLAIQRRAVRALERQNARTITSIIRSTPAYGTENVSPGFVALIHPDCSSDVRNLVGFVPAEKYGSMTPWENELGKCEEVRYVKSTIFEPFQNAGSATNVATQLSTSGANSDVYPILFVGKDAYGIIALKGMYAITPMVSNPKVSDSDPLGQRGHVSWKTMQAAVILNDAFMVRVEVAATL